MFCKTKIFRGELTYYTRIFPAGSLMKVLNEALRLIDAKQSPLDGSEVGSYVRLIDFCSTEL